MKHRYYVLILATVLILCTAVAANAATYKVTIENLCPNVLSPVVFITHNRNFDFFAENLPASSALEALAETGNGSGIVQMAENAGSSVRDVVVTPGGIIFSGESRTIIIKADASRSMLSFAAMIGISNDAFIGASLNDGAISLRDPGLIKCKTVAVNYMDAWDAGTEVNDELATSVGALGAGPQDGVPEYGVVTKPHPGILGIGDIPIEVNWIGYDVARITIEKM